MILFELPERPIWIGNLFFVLLYIYMTVAIIRSILNVWKIVAVEKGEIKTLFHGNKGSRKLSLNDWLACEEKIVSDGGTKYMSGWHVFLDLKACTEYMKRFKIKRYIAACRAMDLRKKEHSRGEVYLAKWLCVKGLKGLMKG